MRKQCWFLVSNFLTLSATQVSSLGPQQVKPQHCGILDGKVWTISFNPHWVHEFTAPFLGRNQHHDVGILRDELGVCVGLLALLLIFVRYTFYFLLLPQKLPGVEKWLEPRDRNHSSYFEREMKCQGL